MGKPGCQPCITGKISTAPGTLPSVLVPQQAPQLVVLQGHPQAQLLVPLLLVPLGPQLTQRRSLDQQAQLLVLQLLGHPAE